MQICLSQPYLSPSHHFLHSNAFSHLNKILPSTTRRGCAGFCWVKNAFFPSPSAHLTCAAENKRGVLHDLLCIFYLHQSAETVKKMDTSGIIIAFSPLKWKLRAAALLSTGGSRTVKALSPGWEKGKCLFFCSYAHKDSLSCDAKREWDLSLFHPLLPSGLVSKAFIHFPTHFSFFIVWKIY